MKKFDNKRIGLTPKELSIIRTYKTPQQIQDYIASIPQNHEYNGDSCMSVREVLKENKAHCIEAALLAALALWVQGYPPLLLDLKASESDVDHVIAVFKEHGRWGAISKSNHIVLRYRDPVYKNLRELVMSYFHEYADRKGQKTLRSYSRPLQLASYAPVTWITGKESWKIAEDLDGGIHYDLVPLKNIRLLKHSDGMEKRLNDMLQYPKR